MRLKLALALLLGLGLCGSTQAETEPLSPLWDQPALGTAPFVFDGQTKFGALTYAGGLYLTTPQDALFGGVSGIEAETDGQSVKFAGITDQGYFLTLTGDLDAGGRFTGAHGLTLVPLRDTEGQVLAGKKEQDAEDISRPPDAKGWLISFERHPRILAYVDPLDPDADVIGLNIPAEAKKLPANRGMEAIAALPGGVILVGAEDGRMWLCPPKQEPCPRIHDKGGMGPLFYLTGLDALPGSSTELVATYRRPSLHGFDSIIARVTLEGRRAVVSQLTALPGIVGNVEGISAVVGPKGGYRFYIVTDNNFDERVPTRLLAFDWKP